MDGDKKDEFPIYERFFSLRYPFLNFILAFRVV